MLKQFTNKETIGLFLGDVTLMKQKECARVGGSSRAFLCT